MLKALKQHWPEYLMETAELAMFMISASFFSILLYHPASPAVRAIPSEFFRRVLTGLAMGLTLMAIVYSPWGKRSGAHMNPAFTLTFLRLGKVAPWDAFFYVTAQFGGGVLGILAVVIAAASSMAHPSINYVACAKYHHQNHFRCIFCEHQASRRFPDHPGELLESKPAVAEPRIKTGVNNMGMPKALIPCVAVIGFLHAGANSALLRAEPDSTTPQTMPVIFASAERKTALLELYTSEGCSSCPPAETWLSQLKDSSGLWKDFVPIAFDVDYWDFRGKAKPERDGLHWLYG